jgi:hypothetical protein
VLEVNPSGTYLVEVTLRRATDTDDGDFDQATLADGQFEIAGTRQFGAQARRRETRRREQKRRE